MKYSILVTLDARVETQEAFYWYEDRTEGLGDEFLRELEHCYSKLRGNPMAYSYLENSPILRHMILHRFPYTVIYIVVKDSVNIVSVKHTSRKPFL